MWSLIIINLAIFVGIAVLVVGLVLFTIRRRHLPR